jgi:hypothetical protein
VFNLCSKKRVWRLDEARGGHQQVPPDWMPATGLRSLILGDPALLWLEHHAEKFGFVRDPEEYSFLHYIGELAGVFEDQWVAGFAPDAARGLNKDWDVRQVEGVQRTVDLMQAGCPVISKAALWWAPERIYGTADLIVKTSYLYARFPHLRPEEDEPDHYVPVDCKMMKGLTSPSKKAHLQLCEAQVRLYACMLQVQGYLPRRAYLVTQDRADDPIPVDVGMTLGQPLPAELSELRDRHLHIKLEGARYRPWEDEIVRPNHGDLGEPWSRAKKEIVARIPGGPLERLPGVGRQQAEALRHFGFESLADVLHPDAAGFPFFAVRGIGGRKADVLQAVVKANRTGHPSPFPASAVPARHAVEIYIDFETLSSICDAAGVPPEDGQDPADEDGQDTAHEGGEIVFMIGCGWTDRGSEKWHYRQFTAAGHSEADEREMFDQFLEWLNERGALVPGASAALYHWSPAEVTFSRRAAVRLGLPLLQELPWVDLLKTFKSVPIGVPAAFGYGLKEIGRSVGQFDDCYAVEWPDGLNGLAALVAGARMYQRESPLESPEFEVLTRYLRTDVRALHEVLRFLRDHGARDRPAGNERQNAGDAATVGPVADSHDNRPVLGGGRGWYALATGRDG